MEIWLDNLLVIQNFQDGVVKMLSKIGTFVRLFRGLNRLLMALNLLNYKLIDEIMHFYGLLSGLI